MRHGFPDDPRCMAYDTVQRLLAIGTGHGVIRIVGDLGVDYCLKHESDAAVLHMQFIMNEVSFSKNFNCIDLVMEISMWKLGH